ncbi:uncharacterized protein [Arachis hypogaea]|uniref:uncharacterized protein n=1 Tax=Arachis hypogaea TaxID=3818 RepID=UPI000DEE1438|nr:uncharacterized protein LOC112769963 [Arachis hypogaea]
MACAVELSQYDLQYEPRQAIKAQAMADFLVEVTGEAPDVPNTRWKLHVDGASNQTFGGAGIILENSAGIAFEQSIKFEFPVSNNQAEYEALIGGLMLAKEVGASRLEVNSDSQVVTSQVNGSYQARDALLQKYLEKVKELCKGFKEVTIQNVPRETNARADLLSKLASTKPGTGNRSLIQGLATEPAIVMCATQAPNPPSWLDPISRYLEHAETPPNQKEAEFIKREAPKYTIIQGQLYKRGLHQPLLKCLCPDQTDYVLREVHEGCCGHHIGERSLARKIIRAGYYWPTMMSDAQEFVKNCKKCQENANFHKAPPEELNLMLAPQPFAQWGVDLLGPFPPGPGQVKYLIVAIDYFTKWVEAEPLASISAANCQKFMWKQVVTRFGIPEAIISDNGTQFTDKKTTPQSSTRETPFRLTYGVDAVIPVEIREPSPRLLLGGSSEAVEKDLADETRQMAHLAEAAIKQRVALRYNGKVLKINLGEGDLVLRRNDIGPPTPGEGKLAANWEGPYRVKEVLGKRSYKLERLNGNEVPRTWNMANLRRFYS